MNNLRPAVLTSIIIFLVLYRIIPHPFNFTPIASIALFAGAKINEKHTAFIVTLLPMMLADLYLGLYNSLIFTYIGLCSIVYLGTFFKNKLNLKHLIISAIIGSLSFYTFSNFGVWLLSGLYEPNLNGLIQCYWMGVPFLQRFISSMLLFNLTLAAMFSLVEYDYRPLFRMTDSA